MLTFTIAQSFFFSDYEDYWCIKLRGILIGLISIPIIFYVYNGVIGKSSGWINISIFFVCAALAYIYEIKELNNEDYGCRSPNVAVFAIGVIALLFVIFTFSTPKLEIFRDPITGAYGM